MLRGNRNLLRRTDIKTRLTLAFIFVPLCLMIVFFLIYYSFSTTVIRDKNEQASAQMVTMSEEIFHLNANALNEQIDNLAASTYLRNYLYRFYNISFFNKFFKQHTGVTPQEYRGH